MNKEQKELIDWQIKYNERQIKNTKLNLEKNKEEGKKYQAEIDDLLEKNKILNENMENEK